MTAREPSAVEVIAEESRRHETLVCLDYEHSTEGEWCCDCGQHSIKETWPEHFGPRALAALKAAGFVVATRDEIGDVWDDGYETVDYPARNPWREVQP